jgi:hypothetical protein
LIQLLGRTLRTIFILIRGGKSVQAKWQSWQCRGYTHPAFTPRTLTHTLETLTCFTKIASPKLRPSKFVSYQIMRATAFLPSYYLRNENIWLDGFLFDFLQKKSADAWVRRFVIYTGFLFSERLVFDSVIRLYIDNLLVSLSRLSVFETNNVSELIVTTLFLFLTLFMLITTFYLLVL